jgi:hypothetical protein
VLLREYDGLWKDGTFIDKPRRVKADVILFTVAFDIAAEQSGHGISDVYMEINVRFIPFKYSDVKITPFWDTAPCSVIEVDRRFRGAYCLHHRPGSGDRDYTT